MKILELHLYRIPNRIMLTTLAAKGGSLFLKITGLAIRFKIFAGAMMQDEHSMNC